MITYKYKLYRTDKTKHLDAMLREACFVWNHALALQKRFYRIFGGYVSKNDMCKHFTKRYKRNTLHIHVMQEIIKRLDNSYKMFFEKKSKRPPKFKKARTYTSLYFICNKANRRKYIDDCNIENNIISFRRIKKQFKFFKSRVYEKEEIRGISLKRNKIGEYFICLQFDHINNKYGKSHNGASVGIDFGLKQYLTLSDGAKYDNPQFLKESLIELQRRSRNLSKCKKGSNNRERKRKEFDRLYNNIVNKRSDFQWKLAHELCRKYDRIFIEDLNLKGMSRRWGRKIRDLAHAEFVQKLEHIATKYGVVVHKIDRFYPSSKTCKCGYINNNLSLKDRQWVCPECGTIHDRDLLAANNILRRGIYELESDSKTSKHTAKRLSRHHPTISKNIKT